MKNIVLFIRQLFCRHHYRYTEINHDGINTVECKRCGKRKIVKVLHLLVLAFMMYGCCRENADISSTDTFLTDYGIIRIEIVDSCEYLIGYNWMAHKGNCKFCAERRKKEQEELIRKIKEQ